MGKNYKHKGGGGQNTGSGGGNGGMSNEDRDTLKSLTAERKKKEEKERDARIEKRLRKKLGREKPKKSKKSKKGSSSVSSSSSDSDSDSESDSDEDEKKKLKKELKKNKSKLKELKKENEGLKAEVAGFDTLKTRVTGHLLPPADQSEEDKVKTPEPKLSLQQWIQWEHSSKVKASSLRAKPRGLFDEEAALESAKSCSEDSGQSAVSKMAQALEAKLQLASGIKCASFGVKVTATTEEKLKKVVKVVVDKHGLNANPLRNEAKQLFEELKTKFKIDSPAQVPSTLLLALVRTCVSRGITLTSDEFQLPGLEIEDFIDS